MTSGWPGNVRRSIRVWACAWQQPWVALQNAFAAALVRSGGSKSQGVSSNPFFWEHWPSGIRNGSLLSISNKTAYTERKTGTRSAIGLRAEHLGTTGGNKSMKRQFSGLAVSAAIVVLAGLLATPAQIERAHV